MLSARCHECWVSAAASTSSPSSSSASSFRYIMIVIIHRTGTRGFTLTMMLTSSYIVHRTLQVLVDLPRWCYSLSSTSSSSYIVQVHYRYSWIYLDDVIHCRQHHRHRTSYRYTTGTRGFTSMMLLIVVNIIAIVHRTGALQVLVDLPRWCYSLSSTSSSSYIVQVHYRCSWIYLDDVTHCHHHHHHHHYHQWAMLNDAVNLTVFVAGCSLSVCKLAYSKPVFKPGNRVGCGRKGIWCKNTLGCKALVCVTAAGLLVVVVLWL